MQNEMRDGGKIIQWEDGRRVIVWDHDQPATGKGLIKFHLVDEKNQPVMKEGVAVVIFRNKQRCVELQSEWKFLGFVDR